MKYADLPDKADHVNYTSSYRPPTLSEAVEGLHLAVEELRLVVNDLQRGVLASLWLSGLCFVAVIVLIWAVR